MSKQLTKIADLIARHQTFLIATHINPDPDALASMLALTKFLRSMGKRVYPVTAEPVPSRYTFLPGIGAVRPVRAGRVIPYDVAIVVDCGDFGRIGPVKEALREGGVLVNIDHHVTNTKFADVNWVVPSASSTSEMIFDLLRHLGVALTRDVATLLYVGIMTDTGSFRYGNTTGRTHEVVAQLMSFPIPVQKLYTRIYETIPLDDIRNFTRLVSRFDFFYDGQVVYLELTPRILKKFSAEFDLRDKIFRYLRAIKGVEVLVILTAEGKNKTRVNFRSQARVDVAQLAYRFHGGGHSRASGCLVSADLATAKERVLAELKKVI